MKNFKTLQLTHSEQTHSLPQRTKNTMRPLDMLQVTSVYISADTGVVSRSGALLSPFLLPKKVIPDENTICLLPSVTRKQLARPFHKFYWITRNTIGSRKPTVSNGIICSCRVPGMSTYITSYSAFISWLPSHEEGSEVKKSWKWITAPGAK